MNFKPLQRMFTTEILLKNIKAKTSQEGERQDLQECHAQIEDLCFYLNQIKCAMDDFTKQRESRYLVPFPRPTFCCFQKLNQRLSPLCIIAWF